MNHIKTFNENSGWKSVYADLVQKCGEDILNAISDNFEELRLSFLKYMLRGDGFDNAVNGAACDVFEGYEICEINDDLLNLLKVLITFGSIQEFIDVSGEF